METNLANKEIRHIVTTPYHPQANSCIKQLNGSLLEILKKLSVGKLYIWPRFLKKALTVCQAREYRGMGYSPYGILFGHRI